MSKDKRSFFEKLTGSVKLEEPMDEKALGQKAGWMEEEADEGQLTVDVYQNPAKNHQKRRHIFNRKLYYFCSG